MDQPRGYQEKPAEYRNKSYISRTGKKSHNYAYFFAPPASRYLPG
jgi:predicted ATPase